MVKLLVRISTWVILAAGVVAGATYAHRALTRARDPQRWVVEEYLCQRLPDLTPQQNRLVRMCAHARPYQAMVAAYRGGYEAVEQLHRDGPDRMQAITAMGLRAATRREKHERLELEAACAFADSTCLAVSLIGDLDAAEANRLVTDLEGLSAEEYRNVGCDPSYLIIAPRLDSPYRGAFRRNQDVLTPILLLTEPAEWNALMAQFVAAQPRVGEILRDQDQGIPFGMTYMLHRQRIRELVAEGIDEKRAIEFVAVNSVTVREAAERNTGWALRARELTDVKAAGGRDLFEWSCFDPSVYRLYSLDSSRDKRHSLVTLRCYAGTDLPTILATQYAGDPALLEAALESIARFDIFGRDSNHTGLARYMASLRVDSVPVVLSRLGKVLATSEPAITAGRAADFLSKHQNDELFKELLKRHGALLIPALATKKADLKDVRQDPKWIEKVVTPEGHPRTEPWWTGLPGGSIVWVVIEAGSGRPLTPSEMGWAAVDVATIIFVGGKIVARVDVALIV